MNTPYDSSEYQNPSHIGADVDAERAEHVGASSVSEGAPPSNTAPDNYILTTPPEFLELRHAVDSLYLSFSGVMASSWNVQLQTLKLLACSEDSSERAQAQVSIGDHLFEVSAKGQRRYPYVLVDNCFRISLSLGTGKVPMAYVQIRSEYLTALGVDSAVQKLRFIINGFGSVIGDPLVSRVDICVDFSSSHIMDSWHPNDWITRAHLVEPHYERRQFTGWSIGRKSILQARLYDKTFELKKSHKDYLKPLWSESGWQADETVWRLEFQFERDCLKEFNINIFPDLIPSLGGLWLYATTAWLRLTVPSDDPNQSRWPTHPLWEKLSLIKWHHLPASSLVRVRKERVPSDHSLFVNGLGSITSFMAREGITDLGEGFGEFLARAHQYHDGLKRQKPLNFVKYISGKVAAKGRRFNSIDNREIDRLAIEQAVKAYRMARDGE